MIEPKRIRQSLLLAALFFGAPFATAATIEQVATAEALFEEARTLARAGKYAEACPKFEESQRLDPGSGTLINLADCYEKQGRTASAWAKYLEAATLAQASGNLERERVARERAEALRAQLPMLSITVATANVSGLEIRRGELVVDRSQWGLEIPVDPGEHQIEARAPGRVPWRTMVTMKSGSPAVHTIVPELAVAAPPPLDTLAIAPRPGLGTQRTLAIAAGAVGVIGVGIGTAYGLRSKAKHDQSFEICPVDPCADAEGREAMRSARTAGDLSTVSFVVAGAALIGGGVLWFTAKSPSGSTSPQLGMGPGRLALRGRF